MAATSCCVDHGRIAELEHSHSRLRKETGEMRLLLEVADEEVAEQRMENAALTSKVKIMESSLRETEQIQVELWRVKSLLAAEQSGKRSKEQEIQKLEEERRTLMEQHKGLSAQLKELQQQKEQGKLDISNLKAATQKLQIKMEDLRQELKVKDETIHQINWQLIQVEEMREEFTNLVRDLKLRNKDLESQLELQQEEAARLINHQATRNPLSIADEVELQACLAVAESTKQKEKDDEKENAVNASSNSQCRSGGHMLQGTLMKGILAIGGVLLLALFAPAVLDIWGHNNDYLSTNHLWKSVHDLFLRYCDIQYKCLPPV